MSPVRFGVQIVVVILLMLAVTWPELEDVRAGSVFRSHGALAATEPAAAGNRSNARQTAQIGIGRAAYLPSTRSGAAGLRQRLDEDTVEGRRRKPTPAAVLALGGKFNAIVGHALTAMSAPLAYARLSLRNLTTGLVEARATANESGEFVFLDVLPSGYLVELIGPGGDVIATSESLVIDIGDLRQTTVRSASESALKAMFGSVMEATASEAMSAASRDGVTQVTAPDRCVSPPCSR